MIVPRRSSNKKQLEETETELKLKLKAPYPSMSSSVESQTEVRLLREGVRPDNFDAWICLGGDYRDMTEVQEWAKDEEKEELFARYADFQVWMKNNPSITQ